MKLALGPIQLGAIEIPRVAWFRQPRLHFCTRERWELAQELRAPSGRADAIVPVAIVEVQEGAAGGKLLTLEQQGRLRAQQQQRGQRPIAPGARQEVCPLPASRVGQLVMVLQEID